MKWGDTSWNKLKHVFCNCSVMWPLTHQINKYICMLGAGSISYSSLWACVGWVQILSWLDSLSYLTEIGCTLHTRWKQQFPSNYCSLWEQIVVVFSPHLGLTASVSLSSHWHYLEDVGLMINMIRLKHWFEAFVCLLFFLLFFSCFGFFFFFLDCCWRKILPQPLVSICYWRCTTCTCEITGRRQSLFLLKQLLIFIQKHKGRLFHTCICESWDICWIQTPDICIEHYIL